MILSPFIRGLGLLLVFLLTQSLEAQGKPSFTPHTVAKIETVGSAKMSPDGAWIAFNVIVPGPLDQGAYSELRVVSRQGDQPPRTFVGAPDRVAAFDWMPDSKSLLFLARRGTETTTGLWQIPIDGGEARSIYRGETSIAGFSIAPDGRRVAFTADAPLSRKMQDERKKGFNQTVYEEDWVRAELQILDLETKTTRNCPVTGSVWETAFAPDGKSITFWMSPTPSVDDSYMTKQLWAFDFETNTPRQVCTTPGKVGSFAFSPNGEWIAFSAAVQVHDPAVSTLFVVPAQGGEIKALSDPEYQGHVVDPSWLDDNTIVFSAAEGCETLLLKSGREGGATEVVIPKGQAIWTSFSLCGGRKNLALVGSTPLFPNEVWTAELGAAPIRRTTTNPTLEALKIGKQEVIRYKARDGLEIEGVTVFPHDFSLGKKYPLIVVVHGGPEAHVSNGWVTSYSNPGQMGAAKGYIVFYPNYRASTGRGVAFSRLDFGKLAEEEFDDLVDGVQFFVDSGMVDKTKVGITGGSYGGYASAWGATKLTDHFAASVMFVGISNQISKRGTTDIPMEDYLVHWGIWPHENWKKMLESSPIYYVPQAKTPILICHGKDDPRVSVTQSMELYRALKNKGDVPVRLVLYPGEGHGNRRGGSRLDYNLRLLEWFDHFLVKGEKSLPPYDINYSE